MEETDWQPLPAFPLRRPTRITRNLVTQFKSSPETASLLERWQRVIEFTRRLDGGNYSASQIETCMREWKTLTAELVQSARRLNCVVPLKTEWTSFACENQEKYTGFCLMYEFMMTWMSFAIHLLVCSHNAESDAAIMLCRLAWTACQEAKTNLEHWTKFPDNGHAIPELSIAMYEALIYVCKALILYYQHFQLPDSLDIVLLHQQQSNLLATAGDMMTKAYQALRRTEVNKVSTELFHYLRFSSFFLLTKANMISARIDIYDITDRELSSEKRVQKLLQQCISSRPSFTGRSSYEGQCESLIQSVEHLRRIVTNMGKYYLHPMEEKFIDRNPKISEGLLEYNVVDLS